ncbi:bacteriohemerythrin [Halonatronum saccharophilum]|uniref:bacteriohemerythrin n=1 Tax=Halonatronum saccharophilum TaxID=150060 RepID=UPI00048A2366|nr:hemerythrin family protein [Halonatronum saccharophilum]
MGISWKKRFEIGVEEIDKQHKELFEQTERLLKACQEKRGSEELESLLEFLGNYVQTHFETEEKLQKKYNYPDYKEHKKAHNDFVKKIEEFKQEFKEGKKNVASLMRLNRTITRWLVNHIKKEDQGLGDYIKGNS